MEMAMIHILPIKLSLSLNNLCGFSLGVFDEFGNIFLWQQIQIWGWQWQHIVANVIAKVLMAMNTMKMALGISRELLAVIEESLLIVWIAMEWWSEWMSTCVYGGHSAHSRRYDCSLQCRIHSATHLISAVSGWLPSHRIHWQHCWCFMCCMRLV